jgi:hypothetical protein
MKTRSLDEQYLEDKHSLKTMMKIMMDFDIP